LENGVERPERWRDVPMPGLHSEESRMSIVFDYREPQAKSKVALQDGSSCPVCQDGFLAWQQPENCSCHLHPPCPACTEAPLICVECNGTFNREGEEL
jgi:hypothetical protein